MRKTVTMLAIMGLLAGCASDPFRIPQPTPGKDCTPLSETEGGAGAMLLFGVFPAGKNGMVERAYSEALQLISDN